MMKNEMPRCKNCAKWKRDDNDKAGWGYCASGASSKGEPNDANTLVYAIDHEEYWAFLKTHAEFGCVQFRGA